MQPINAETLGRGLTYESYRESVSRNGDLFDEVYRSPAFGAGDLEFFRRLPSLSLLAICEDWSPDVYNSLPTWSRLVSQLQGWELRIFPLSEHPEMITPFLHRAKAKRLPVYAFYDSRGYLQTWWSGRGAAAQDCLDGLLGGRTFSRLGREEKEEFGRRLDDAYRRDLRRRNFLEIRNLLMAFFHIS